MTNLPAKSISGSCSKLLTWGPSSSINKLLLVAYDPAFKVWKESMQILPLEDWEEIDLLQGQVSTFGLKSQK